MVEKCISDEPTDRYCDAGDLADDLRRHLSDLPLRGVSNRSLRERWQKSALSPSQACWPVGSPGSSAAGNACDCGVSPHVSPERFHEIESALRDGERLRTEGRLAEGGSAGSRPRSRPRIPRFWQSYSLVVSATGSVQRTQRAASVHELANLIRFRHAVDLPSANEARLLIKHIRTVWNERDALLGSNVESLDPQSEQVIRTDVLELAITLAELRLGRATAVEAEAARRDVEQLLNAALKWCGAARGLTGCVNRSVRHRKSRLPPPRTVPPTSAY